MPASARRQALAWKDALCSPYFIDTDGDGVVPEHQRIVLQILVRTRDEEAALNNKCPALYVALAFEPAPSNSVSS